MNKIANNKGITLTALVVTIILLLILAGVAISAGKSSIESARLSSYGIELQTMQNKVNELNQQLLQKNIDPNEVQKIKNLGNSLQNSNQEDIAFTGAGISDRTGYRHYDKETVKELGFPNYNQEFLVNVETRSVILLNGIEYNGETKWTTEQLNDVYNVNYTGINSKPEFEVTTDGNKIYVSNIRYNGNVKKGTIYYGKVINGTVEKWNIAKTNTEEITCTIEVMEDGEYGIKIIDSAGNKNENDEIKKVSVKIDELQIINQTYDVNVVVGQTATFSVDIKTAGDGEITYTWYKNSINSTDNGIKIEETNNKIYTIPNATMDINNTYYYCIVTKSDGANTKTVTTVPAKLTVSNKIRPTITLSESSGAVNYNETKTITVKSSVNGTWNVTSANESNVQIISGNNVTTTSEEETIITYKANSTTTEQTTISIVFIPDDTIKYERVEETYTVNAINKLQSTPPVLENAVYEFNGQPHTVTITSEGNGGTIKYRASTDGGVNYGQWQDNAPTITNYTDANSGTLYVQAYIQGDNNHADSEVVTATVRINTLVMTASGTDYIGKYDGESHKITVNTSISSNDIEIYYSTQQVITENDVLTESARNASGASTTNPTRTVAGTTTVYWCVIDKKHNYNAVNGNNNITINKQEVNLPTNLNISTAGIVTWTESENATSYEISVDNNTWETATSGINYLNKIITTVGNVNVYIKAKNSDTENYINATDAVTTTVTVNKITVLSNDESYGTIEPSSHNVIKGTTYKTNNNILTIEGKTPNSETVNIGTITATGKNGYQFESWSSGTGTINNNTTITANFTGNSYTVTFNANGGNVNQTNKPITYNNSYGELPTPTREGYTFKGWNGKNLFDESTKTVDAYINSNGTVIPYKNDTRPWSISDYIEIENGQAYTFNPNSTEGASGKHAIYDENKNFIMSNASGLATITMPSNAKYIRVSFRSDDSHDIQLEKGSTATSYEPYYVSSGTKVTQATNHTLIAKWADETAPIINANNINYGQDLNITIEDSGSGVVGWQVTNSNTKPTSGWTDITPTSSINVTKSGLTVGTWYIWAKDGADNVSSKQIIVNRASSTLTLSMSNYTYGGTKNNPTINGDTGNREITYYYRTTNGTTDGTNWNTVTTSTNLNAGTYYMYAIIAGTAEYEEITTDAIEFTIEKAQSIAPTIESTTYDYNGQPHTITTTSVGNGGTIQYRASTDGGINYGDWQLSSPTITNYSEATNGTLYVQAKIKGDINHTDSETVTATVHVGTSSMEYTGNTNYTGTYDGQGHRLNIVVTQPSEAQVYYSKTALTQSNYTTGQTTCPTITNVSESTTIYWYIKSNSQNYADAVGSNDITINKANVTLSNIPEELQYVGKDMTKSFTAIATVNGTWGVTSGDTNVTIGLGNNFTGTSNHIEYTGSTASVTATTITITFTPTDSVNYNTPTAKTFTVKTTDCTVNETELNLYIEGNNGTVNLGGTNAGTFTIANLAQSQSYNTSYTDSYISASISGNILTITPIASTTNTITLTVKESNANKTTTINVTVSAIQYKVAFRPNKAVLPSEYKEIDYLESSGTQYINTGVPGNNNNLSFEIKYAWAELPTGYSTVFGSYQSEDHVTTRLIQNQSNTTYYNVNSKAGSSSRYSVTRTPGTIYTEKLSSNGDIISYESNGESASFTRTNGTDTNNTICVFSTSNGVSKVGNKRIYYFKIYNSGTLIRNMIPCYKMENGEKIGGLYDTVNNTFYRSATQDNFIVTEKTQDFTYNVQQALSTNTFTNSGVFMGWSTSSNGTGTIYTDEQQVSNLSNQHGSVVDLYAIYYDYNTTFRFYANREEIVPGYKKMDYIESTRKNGQYIDTGLSGNNNNLSFEVQYEWLTLPDDGEYQYIFGAYNNEDTNSTRMVQYGSETTYYNINSIAGGGSGKLETVRSTNTIYIDEISPTSSTSFKYTSNRRNKHNN